tara:strand:+ start:302 stop:634 length:333 start_codon:yes stop_codon:yes gene_type:complete
MTFSLHRVPFVNWTHAGGDISNMTDLSIRLSQASDNLRQSLPVFLVLAILSIDATNALENIFLAKIWFGLRIAYLLGAFVNLYKIPMVRPVIWLPSVVIMVMMGINLCMN